MAHFAHPAAALTGPGDGSWENLVSGFPACDGSFPVSALAEAQEGASSACRNTTLFS